MSALYPPPNTLIVSQKVGRLLRLDYAAAERRVLAHHVDIETFARPRSSGDPVKACTRLLERIPDWTDFERRVEQPTYGDWKLDEWHDLYGLTKEAWDRLIENVIVTDPKGDMIRDVRAKRPKFDPMPHQTTGAEALDRWKTTAGHYG